MNNRMQTESKMVLLLSCYDFYQGEWFFIWKGRKYIFELIILKNKKLELIVINREMRTEKEVDGREYILIS